VADQLILFTRGDLSRAQQIVRAFAERTGLTPSEVAGGVSFALGPDDHRIQVVQVLTDIDAGWSAHLSLGDPQSEPNPVGAA
jgi:hypothetical protein